jgi:hypothetical protein
VSHSQVRSSMVSVAALAVLSVASRTTFGLEAAPATAARTTSPGDHEPLRPAAGGDGAADERVASSGGAAEPGASGEPARDGGRARMNRVLARAPRAAGVTVGLMIAGAIVGGILGAGLLAAVGLLVDGPGGFPYVWDAFVLAALVGARLGAIGLPVLTWGLLRRVSLGRILAYTASGTVLGSAAGLLGSHVDPFLAVAGASVGFGAAGVGLWLRARDAGAITRQP